MRILLFLSIAIFSAFGTKAQNNTPLDPVKWFYVAQKTADGVRKSTRLNSSH